jgi:hypothetical protein
MVGRRASQSGVSDTLSALWIACKEGRRSRAASTAYELAKDAIHEMDEYMCFSIREDRNDFIGY